MTRASVCLLLDVGIMFLPFEALAHARRGGLPSRTFANASEMEMAHYQQNLCKTLCKIMRSRLKVYATLAVITR